MIFAEWNESRVAVGCSGDFNDFPFAWFWMCIVYARCSLSSNFLSVDSFLFSTLHYFQMYWCISWMYIVIHCVKTLCFVFSFIASCSYGFSLFAYFCFVLHFIFYIAFSLWIRSGIWLDLCSISLLQHFSLLHTNIHTIVNRLWALCAVLR